MRITYRQLIRRVKLRLAMNGFRLSTVLDGGKIKFFAVDSIGGGIHSYESIEQAARTCGVIQEGESVEIISPTTRT